jgi:hypothetical protein
VNNKPWYRFSYNGVLMYLPPGYIFYSTDEELVAYYYNDECFIYREYMVIIVVMLGKRFADRP